MSDGTEDLYTDPLFVGLTRPATILGIPYNAFVIEFMSVTLIFLAIGNPLYMLLAVPLHGILYLISATDHAMFDNFFIWVKTSGRCLNRGFWGASSFAPLASKKWVE